MISLRTLFLVLWTMLVAEVSLAEGFNPDSYVLDPDYELSLVAIEPVVRDPVDVEFDEHGTPFVLEMPGYPFAGEQGRIVRLTDRDDDNHYEQRDIFAEDLGQADSMLPYRGGMLVAAPPDLLYLKDTDGDGVADQRDVLLSGFAVGNPQHNFNGLTHGLDNWIHGANGGNGGLVHWPETPEATMNLGHNDFRLDLRAQRFEIVGHSTGGFGIALDAWGRFFGTHNLEPMSHLVYFAPYRASTPMGRDDALTPIVDDAENGLTRIYPIGAQETRVNHPEQSGYFSGGCGITHYGGGNFGPDAEGDLFVCDVVLNLIHRRHVTPDGSSFLAHRVKTGVEFLASTERAFRPVNMAVAPDGSLWVLDMHREVIEHPEWIPDEIEVGLDLEAGKQQGRLLRIRWKGATQKEIAGFSREDLPGVVAALGDPNQWRRTTAQRLLVEWNNPSAIPLLKDAAQSALPLARLHAFWTLDGLGQLDDETLIAALRDADPGVRENALLMAHGRVGSNDALLRAALALANDDAPRVRLNCALLLGNLPPHKDGLHTAAMMSIVNRDLEDPWIRQAMLPAIGHAPLPVIEAMLSGNLGATQTAAPLLTLVGELVGASRSVQQLYDLLVALNPGDNSVTDELQIALWDGITRGIEGRSDRLRKPDEVAAPIALFDALEQEASLRKRAALWRLRDALRLPQPAGREAQFASAANLARDETQPHDARIDAMRILAFDNLDHQVDLYFGLLDTRQPKEIQTEAIRHITGQGGMDEARRLIESWRDLGPAVRGPASDFLLYSMANQKLLLDALENRTISLGEMNLHLERRRAMLDSPIAEVRTRAQALFSDAGIVTRKQAIEAMRPALALTGDAAKGRAIFEERCSKCHRVGDLGGTLAPNLTEIARKSAETILHDILDPNAAVDTRYVAYTIQTSDFETFAGIIEEETGESITLRDANGDSHTIRRDAIEKMNSGGLSIMPEELEAGLDPQAFADLLAFLMGKN